MHLRIRSHDDAGAGAPELSPSSSDLELSRPAAAVLASVARSRAMSKAAGVLVLSHLATFRPDDAGITISTATTRRHYCFTSFDGSVQSGDRTILGRNYDDSFSSALLKGRVP